MLPWRFLSFLLYIVMYGQDSGNNSEVAMELSIFVSWIATMWGKPRKANNSSFFPLMLLIFMLTTFSPLIKFYFYLCQMKKTQFSFLLSGDQTYFDFLSLTAHQKKNQKSWKSHILDKSRYSLYFPKFHTEILWWKSIHCEPTSHNCHTELPCDLSEQHRCIIHSQLCSLCNTKIHFLIPILTVHCLQVWCMMRESAFHSLRILRCLAICFANRAQVTNNKEKVNHFEESCTSGSVAKVEIIAGQVMSNLSYD